MRRRSSVTAWRRRGTAASPPHTSHQRLLRSDGVEVLRIVPANRNPAGAPRAVVGHRVQHVGWSVQNVTLARDEVPGFELGLDLSGQDDPPLDVVGMEVTARSSGVKRVDRGRCTVPGNDRFAPGERAVEPGHRGDGANEQDRDRRRAWPGDRPSRESTGCLEIRVPRLLPNGGDEPISALRNGFNVALRLGFTQRFSKYRNGSVEVSFFVDRVVLDFLQQPFFCDQMAGVFNEHPQKVEHPGRERDQPAIAEQPVFCEIERAPAELKRRL